MIISLLVSCMLILVYGNRISKSTFFFLLVNLVFTLLFILILIFSVDADFLLKDFVECLKPTIYALIFISGWLLSKRYSQDQAVRFILIAGVLSVLFSYLVFYPAAYPLVDLYKARQSTAENPFHFFRFSGTLGYPGGFGYWLVFVMQVSLLQLYRGVTAKKLFLLQYGFLLSGLILSGSRGALLIYIIVNLMTVVSIPRHRVSWVVTFFIFWGLVLFLGLLFFIDVELQAIKHFQAVLDAPSGGTFQHRASELQGLILSLSQGYLLGHGPSNSEILDAHGPIESVYYFYGYKFGLVGLVCYFFWVSLVAFIYFRLIIANQKLNLTFFFCLWALINMVVAGVSNSITEEYKSFYMFFLLLGFTSGGILDSSSMQSKRQSNPILYKDGIPR
ncbi:hypothetical protein [Teredinibacter turnerae]|nr:hypothetical protein [Teredinibacter turnerae]